MESKHLWYEKWFDSPFYHILYGHRDESEAKLFIRNLINYLKPQQDSKFLDLACGKGRHSVVINKLGYRVHGIDLSENSIEYAKEMEGENLTFSVGDMRECYRANTFNYVLNLFTSFGYFSKWDDHHKTLQVIHDQLKPNGTLVLDYINVAKAEKEIGDGLSYQVESQGITFNIQKSLSENHVNKSIDFTVNDRDFHFSEHIWRLHLHEFTTLLESASFDIQTIYGDYELSKFSPSSSERLIIIAQKK